MNHGHYNTKFFKMNIKQYLDSTYLKTAEQAGITETENINVAQCLILRKRSSSTAAISMPSLIRQADESP